jgi:glutathione S-transferase
MAADGAATLPRRVVENDMPRYTLVCGNKNYSSWSLRAYLALAHVAERVPEVTWDELVIPLDEPTTHERILQHSPSGRVPALRTGSLVVWDSLAICEYLAECHPEAQLWPVAAPVRAVARSASAEMHAGFASLRAELPMDLRRAPAAVARSASCERELGRIFTLWRELRGQHGGAGPFLFGAFSVADAMFGPVATRLRSYAVALDPVCAAYVETIHALPAFGRWLEAARAEPWVLENP